MPQLIKNEWKAKGRSPQLLLELFNSHLSGGSSAVPTGHAVYSVLNSTVARHCQVLCNTVPQLLEISSHTVEKHMKVLILKRIYK